LIIAVLTSLWIYARVTTIAVYEYPTDITITDEGGGGGLGIRKGEMHFGVIHAGFTSRSGVIAYNFLNQSVKVRAYPRTNFTQWMEFTTPKEFILPPNEKQEINVTVSPPDDAKPGKYTGTLLVVFKKV